MPKLQIALDFIDLSQALEMASKVAPYCDILEAGTPLVKSVGMECVAELKKNFPDKLIFADLKTMDAGELEVNLAAGAGANYVSIMAMASDTTIKSALASAAKQNVTVVFDLMGTLDKLKRAREVVDLGAKYLHIHTGLDEQTEGKDPLKTLELITKNTHVQLTVAGGINSSNIEKILLIPRVEIVMVGQAITSSFNPQEEARKLWNISHFMENYGLPTHR